MLPVEGKRPTLKNWPTAASTDPQRLSRWFDGDSNIGVATGQESGIVVLDIDPRNGGSLSLKRLEQELGPLPATVTANTGGGGTHYVFSYFEGAKSRTAADGIDFLADGKMFVATPSMHPDTGALYEWQDCPFTTELQSLPVEWQEYLSNGQAGGLSSAPIPEGQRNATMLSIAGKLRQQGVSTQKIKVQLLEDNELRCQPPLSLEEIEQIVESVSRHAPGNQSFKTRWQEAVASEQMPKEQKLTLMILSLFADVRGRSCYPTQEQIAERVCCTEKTARKHLVQSAKEGWITRYKKNRTGKTGYSYGYVLKLKDR
jgi:putative DNA primase/helicase